MGNPANEVNNCLPQVQVLTPPEEVLIARSPVVALKFPAVPMLVAVPVPEVAPEAPAPPALLPLQSLQPLQPHPLNEAAAPSPLSEKLEEADIAPAPSVVEAIASEAAAANSDAPEAAAAPVISDAAASAAETPTPTLPVAQPAVETNQVEPEAAKKVSGYPNRQPTLRKQ